MLKKILRVWFVITHTFIFLNLIGCTEGVLPLRKGAVSGRVYDTNNLSVKNATITSHRSLLKAETDEFGRYSLTGLDLGSHNFTVERDGYYLGSATVEIKSGEAIDDFDILVEAYELSINHKVSVREMTRAIIDVDCFEPMSIVLSWREKDGHRIQNPPTEYASSHKLELTNLHSGSEYEYFIVGTTKSGQTFVTKDGFFRARATGDLEGNPDKPNRVFIVQGKNGPQVKWEYTSSEPLRGFRVLRGIEDEPLSLYADETLIFHNDNSFEDVEAKAGQIYRYAVVSVDLDDNHSEPTEAISFVPAGTLSNNQVWKAKHSPIRLSGDIIIPEKLSLIIEPGVTVIFDEEDKMQGGYEPLKCEFLVLGCLYAQGTPSAPIRFISSSSLPSKKDWAGIRIVKTKMALESMLENIVVAGAEVGLEMQDSCAQVENITTRYCDYGLKLNTASGTEIINYFSEDSNIALYALDTINTQINGFKVLKSRIGARLASNRNLSLRNFDLRNIENVGVESVNRAETLLKNGVIQSKELGLMVGGASGVYEQLTIDALSGIEVSTNEKSTIKNNIIVNRLYAGQGYGIEDKSTENNSYPYNNIFGYFMETYNCNQGGAIIQNLDPKFLGGAQDEYDYHLSSGSPLLRSSDKFGELGAYGRD